MVADLLKIRLNGAEVVADGVLILEDGVRLPRYVVKPANDQCDWKAVEVIEVAYDDLIAERHSEHSLIRHLAVLIRTVIGAGWRLIFLGSNRVPEATRRHRVLAFLFPFGIYVGLSILLISFITLAKGILEPICNGDILGPICQDVAGYFRWVPHYAALNDLIQCLSWGLFIISIIVSALPWFVKKKRLEKFEDATRSALAFVEFQKSKSKLRSVILDRVSLTLRACLESGRNEDVSIVAYSEGSLVLMDALFPPNSVDNDLAATSGVRVKMLVTLGCPLAIVRLLWPRPAEQHERRNVHVEHWINFFERADPLGSSLSRLIGEEGIAAKIHDHKFHFRGAKNIIDRVFPHRSYWDVAKCMPCPPLQLIADKLARRVTNNGGIG